MEAREGPSTGVTVIGAEAPSNYYALPREENPSPAVAEMVPPAAKRRNTGASVRCSAGPDFIPHIITADAGEDIISKIISISVERRQATCVLSGYGTISKVTLQRPDSPNGILTYEGPYEIVSLTGSFTPSGGGGATSWAGGLSTALASLDGHILGGVVAGLMVTAGAVQVMAGSIHPRKQKLKKARNESAASKPNVASPSSGMNLKG